MVVNDSAKKGLKIPHWQSLAQNVPILEKWKNLSLSKAESFSDLSRVRKVIETQPLDKNFFWRMKGKGSFGDFEIKKT